MDVRHDLERTFYAALDDTDLDALNDAFASLEADVRALLNADDVSTADIVLERRAQMRYVGQSYEVTTPVPGGRLEAGDIQALHGAFNDVHEREYGVSSSDFAVAFVTLRVTGIGQTSKPQADELAAALGSHRSTGYGSGSVKENRRAYFGGEHHDVEVHDVTRLAPDQEISGPAIIEQADGVIVVPPGSIARADRFDNVTITPAEVLA
jgi:N-methylhydantoinase A